MTKLAEFTERVRYQTLVVGYSSDHDPDVSAFVWLLNVPKEKLRAVEREAIGLAIDLHGDAALAFIVRAASPEKTKALLAANDSTNAVALAHPRHGTPAYAPARFLQKGGTSSAVACARSRVTRTTLRAAAATAELV